MNNIQNRLSPEDIDRMIKGAEKLSDDNKNLKLITNWNCTRIHWRTN